MKRTAMILFLVVFTAPLAMAQNAGLNMPRGKWWRVPRVVERLNILPAQQTRLDKVFDDAAPELIDMRADMQKKALALRDLLDATKLDAKAISQAADALSESRGKIFNREMAMMVDMRNVLDDTQWTMLRHALEQRGRQGSGERGPANQNQRQRPRRQRTPHPQPQPQPQPNGQ